MNPTEDFTSPQQIADALDAIAGRIRALPRTEIPSTHVSLDIWVHGDHPVDARRAVDLLGYAATGDTGSPRPGSCFYRTPSVAPDGLAASAITAVPQSTDLGGAQRDRREP